MCMFTQLSRAVEDHSIDEASFVDRVFAEQMICFWIFDYLILSGMFILSILFIYLIID